MEKTIDELLQAPYWIVDILPEQVPVQMDQVDPIFGRDFDVEKEIKK